MISNAKIAEYYAHNARKLCKVVDKCLKEINHPPDDEFYSFADEVFVELINKYDDSKGNVDGFIYFSIRRRVRDLIKWKNCEKRTQYARDKDGNKILDEDGKPISIRDVSLDAPIGEEGFSLVDILKSNVDEEKKHDNKALSVAMTKYLSRLSPVQRNILELVSYGYSKGEIIHKLHIKGSVYDSHMTKITSFERTRDLHRLRGRA